MASIERSTEVRWFFEGPISKEVKYWFTDNARLGDPLTDNEGEEREDLYLIAAGGPEVSPKLRGGKLEIKLCDSSEDILGPEGKSIGKGEHWKKWNKWKYSDLKEESGKKLNEIVIQGFVEKTPMELRFNVWKKRWRHKFEVLENGELQPVSKKRKDLPFGILAELTELKVNGKQWWTTAFEVFGEPEEPMAILQRAVTWLLMDYPGPSLEVDNSYSYPEWLSTL